MSVRLLTLGCLILAGLACATPASATWTGGGDGTGTASTASMPTGATPTATASERNVTVIWSQNAFVGSTLGARGGGYTLQRYAEASTTPITPGAPCAGTITGTAATLSCVEANVPYGRWQYRVTPVIGSFVGTQGPLGAVVAVVLAAPVLTAVTAQNPAAGATNGPVAISWEAVGGATGYNLFRRVSGGSYDVAAPLNGATPLTTTMYSDTTGTASRTYDYVVRAVASPPATVSADSNQRSAQVIARPAAPAGAVTATPGVGGAVAVAWSASSDATGYNVYRRTEAGAFDYATPLNGATPLAATSFSDTTAATGTTYRYVVRGLIIGAGGVQVQSADSLQSTTSSCTPSTYAATVAASGPFSSFRLADSAAATAVNGVDATRNGTYAGGVTFGQPGAILCDTNTAVTFNGSTGLMGAANTTAATAGPNAFTLQAWFKTTAAGGKIIGFGNQRTTQSSQHDRHVYLSNAGKLVFGVYPGSVKTVVSPLSYNDGAWHMATATLGAAGMRLYVDGAQVAADAAVTTGRAFSGYWRVGYDSINSWGATQPSNFFFTGSIDEVAIFTSQLPATTIASHFAANRP